MPKNASFTPLSWLKNTHFQVMGSVFVPRRIRFLPSEDRLFDLKDGSKLVAECSWQKNRAYTTTLVIVHGLNGSTISSYIRGTASKAFEKGFNVVRINLRNGGNREEMSKTLCHAGQSDDIKTVVDELIAVDKTPRIGIIAFSFGANLCLKAAAEWGENYPKELLGIVGLSPMIDVSATADALDLRAPAVYRWQLLRGLKAMIKKRNKLFPGQLPELRGRIRTMREFDNLYAPSNGFKDAADYYAKTSCLPLLDQVRVPVLLITAEDDVVIPVHSFKDINNPDITVLISRHGGHGGFIAEEMGDDPDRHWAENRAVEFFEDV